jgi:putative ABC transport system permease protein
MFHFILVNKEGVLIDQQLKIKQTQHMFKHFFKHTWRLFFRNGMYSFINLAGLSLGLAAGIIILVFVGNQISYDRFHTQGKNIYQIGLISHSKDQTQASNTIPAAIGPSLKEEFPEVVSVTRISDPVPGYFSYNEKTIMTGKISWADSTFFDTFSFELINGNPQQALTTVFTAVLTPKIATALFGNADPIGQVIKLNNEISYLVTGLIKDPPGNSHIQYDVLLSFSSLYEDRNLHMGWDGGNRYINYLMMAEHMDWELFHQKLPAFMYEKINQQIAPYGFSYEMKLYPLYKAYLHSGHYGNPLLFVYIFSAIAVFILLIACINFTNISTAQALKRARETGLRKVSGATRWSLIRQFLGEAILISGTAFIIALLFVELMQPFINSVTGLELYLFSFEWNVLLPALLALIILTGILAGAYPAFYLASFQPVRVFKGGVENGKVKNRFSMILVVIQFVISVTLINASIILFQQLSYLNRYDTGMNSSHVVWLNLPGKTAIKNYETFRNEILSIAGVEACGASSEIPGRWVTSNGYRINGADDVHVVHVLDVDDGFIETLGLQMVKGRNFTKGSETDRKSYLVNESFIRQYGIYDYQTAKIRRNGEQPIIGIVKDFHFTSLKHPVKPLIITNDPHHAFEYLLLRINPENIQQVLAQIEDRWIQLHPGDPFHYGYLDDYIRQSYDTEKKIGQLFGSFTGILLIVACIGLFGLSSVMIRQRQREIGLRKLLGASTLTILKLVTSTFTGLVILANILAIAPLYYIVRFLMGYYSYSVSFNPWWFVFTGVATLVLALATVIGQSYRISKTNPAEVIKYE